MSRFFLTSFFILLLLTSCISENHKSENGNNGVSINETIEEKSAPINFTITGVKNFKDGLDSITIISVNGKGLFKIADGGNIELLTDTVVTIGKTDLGIITLADYFQDNQIFYVIYNPTDSVSLQSERLYLPYIGMDITQYKQLDSITLVGDSLSVKSHTRPEINLSLALDTLICNSDGIINYYEFE